MILFTEKENKVVISVTKPTFLLSSTSSFASPHNACTSLGLIFFSLWDLAGNSPSLLYLYRLPSVHIWIALQYFVGGCVDGCCFITHSSVSTTNMVYIYLIGFLHDSNLKPSYNAYLLSFHQVTKLVHC